jgi:hypothetical protein
MPAAGRLVCCCCVIHSFGEAQSQRDGRVARLCWVWWCRLTLESCCVGSALAVFGSWCHRQWQFEGVAKSQYGCVEMRPAVTAATAGHAGRQWLKNEGVKWVYCDRTHIRCMVGGELSLGYCCRAHAAAPLCMLLAWLVSCGAHPSRLASKPAVDGCEQWRLLRPAVAKAA